MCPGGRPPTCAWGEPALVCGKQREPVEDLHIHRANEEDVGPSGHPQEVCLFGHIHAAVLVVVL